MVEFTEPDNTIPIQPPGIIIGITEEFLNLGIPAEYIPAALMTFYFESNLDQKQINTNKNGTKDIGITQINAASFFDDKGNPDPTLKSYLKKQKIKTNITQKEFEEHLKELDNNIAFAGHYLKRIIDNPKSFKTGGDPLVLWNAYKDYVKPMLEGELFKGRGDNEVSKQEDRNKALSIFIESFYAAGLEKQNEELDITGDVKEQIAKKIDKESYKEIIENFKNLIKEETRGREVTEEEIETLVEEDKDDEGVTLYNKYNQPVLVDKSIADDLVNNTDYTYESKETNPFKGGKLMNKYPDTFEKIMEFDERLQKRVSDAAEAIGEDFSTISSMFEQYLGTNYMQFFKKLLTLEELDSPIPFRKPDPGPDPGPATPPELQPKNVQPWEEPMINRQNSTVETQQLDNNFRKLFGKLSQALSGLVEDASASITPVRKIKKDSKEIIK